MRIVHKVKADKAVVRTAERSLSAQARGFLPRVRTSIRMLRMHRPAATGIATTFMVRAVSPRVVPSTLTSVLLISDYKTSRLHPIVRLVAPVEPLRIQAVRAMRVKVARCGLRQTVVGTQSLLIRIGPREAKVALVSKRAQGGVGWPGSRWCRSNYKRIHHFDGRYV